MKKGISILLILAMLCGLLLSAAGESKSGKGVELDVEDIELSPDGLELILDDGIPVEGGGALLEPEDLNQDAVALEQQEEFTVQEEPSGATSLDDFYIVEGRVIDYWGNDEEVVIPDHGEDGIAVYKIEYAFSQNSRIKKVTIPEGVSIIGTEAFRNCTNLEEVIIPSTVRAIESYAFFDCASLETLTIPASSIGWEAFAECTKLESVKFLNKVNEIGECAFNKCSSLKRLTLPDGLDCIEGGLFNGCTSLQEVTIPDSVASIGYHVFSGCSSLKRLTVPKKVSLIGHWFYDCTSLESVTIHKNVTEIYTNVFDTCPNVTLYVEAGSYAEEYAKRIGVRYKIIQPDDIFIDQGSSATLYMGNTLALTVITSETGKLTWKSSKPAVATVNQKGVVTPKSAGTTTVTVTTEKKNSAKIKIKVVDIDSVEIVQGTALSMSIGTKKTLKAQLFPEGTKDKLKWKSSNKKVATVTQAGVVKAIKVGSAVITVTTTNGKQAKCKVTVKPKITLSDSKMKLKRNKSSKLSVTFAPDSLSNKKVTWQSSRPSVATVSSKGVVKAMRPGKTEITATLNADKTVKATCTVTVPGEYRALLIGQGNYKVKLPGCVADAYAMQKMLLGLEDKFTAKTCKVKESRSAKQILKDIDDCFGSAGEDDVSIFFYSGHGCNNGGGSFQGALVGTGTSDVLEGDANDPRNSTDGYVTPIELAEALGRVRGRVILVINACYSGALIHTNSAQESAKHDFDPNSFIRSYIDAFSGKGVAANGGELREKKFIVLVAAGYDQNAKISPNYSAFTSVLIKGMGCNFKSGKYSGSMPADANKDNGVSVSELCKYINKNMYAELKKYQKADYYAMNKDEIMFGR